MGDEKSVTDFAIWYLIFLVALTIHEAAHALVAWWGGDDTAYRGGQVTLNPWPHVRREPFGTVAIPLLTYFFSGYMMGWASAPYDLAWGKRYPGRLAAMSAAGPAANLLLALAVFLVLKGLLLGGIYQAPGSVAFNHLVEPAAEENFWAAPLGSILSITLNLNLLLFLFNLIPLPPLDGSSILAGFLPNPLRRLMDSLRENPVFSLLGLLIVWRFFSYRPAFSALLSLLHPDHAYEA